MKCDTKKTGMKVLAAIIIAAVLFSTGCAARQKELLAQDYMHMTNDQLLKYYYELSEEIDRCAKESNRSPSVGLGTGFGLGYLGIGIGVSKGIHGCDTEELRKRRVSVKVELHRRGMNPENNVI